ncbi:sensor domain-containing protein [Pseudoalteromonas peptidolytica]|uniref:sensor domain-containing protein n=1 Tax=Pseudoalteromonas peptidolytica TaxID=61150 RepID=UPI00298E2DF9|nr:EAL domain-containing protein [Pseudoalteromonas peptidolytica]MDW7548874.1 EAL domain-containing protein [Pseudoalteromonas peptidolytica]
MKVIFSGISIVFLIVVLMADKFALFNLNLFVYCALCFVILALLLWYFRCGVSRQQSIHLGANAPCPQLLLDGSGVVVQANDQARCLFADVASVEGESLDALISVSNTKPESEQGLLPVLLGQQNPNCTLKCDGSAMTAIVVPLYFNGSHCRYICIFKDMKKEVELTEAFEAEKELLEVTVNSIGDGVICTDTQGVITYVNPVTEAVLAMLSEEVVGRHFDDVMPMYHEVTKTPLNEFPERCLKQGHTICLPELTSITNHLGLTFAIQDSFSPIIAKDGTYLGTVMVFQDVTESRLMAKKMNHLAHHDSLTGLPNRLLLHDRLVQTCKRAKRVQHQFALIFVDVNKFKKINDSLGHDYGDLLLKEIASRLTGQIRRCDTVARVGGDEFVILIDSIKNKKYVRKVISKILACVNGQYTLERVTIKACVSAGVAIYPDDGEDSEALIKHADAAMYRAKKIKQTEFQFYNARLDHEAEKRLQQESDLIAAIQNQAFVPFYQPIIDAHTRKIKKLEVLARWQQGDQLLLPKDFFEVACDGELMIEIGQQIRQRALRAMQTWCSTFDNLIITFNFSLVELTDQTLMKQFLAQIAQHQIAYRQVEIEIKEVDIIDLIETAPTVLQELEQTGIRIAIDHFGIGHANMLYLQDFVFDAVKIPPAFLASSESLASQNNLIKVVVQIAKTLEIESTAVGVETPIQAKSLNLAGCHLIQGNHLYPPLSETDVTPLLNTYMSIERRKAK